MTSSSQRLLGLAFILGLLLFGYSNCAGPLSSSVNPYDLSSQADDRLTLSPQAQSVNWGGTLQFEATGGTAPYSYSIVAGGGTLNPHTGFYTAPSYDQTLLIQVRDEDGNIAQASAIIAFATSGSIKLTTTPANIRAGDTVTLSASGGTAPYTYKLVSGVGTITGATYKSETFGSAVIGIIDSKKAQNSATLFVTTNPTADQIQIYKWLGTASKKNYYAKTNTPTTGWTYQGPAFKAFKSNSAGRVQLVQCQVASTKAYYLNSNAGCGANTALGEIGYILYTGTTETLPLYSCFNEKSNNYLATTSEYDCTHNGYKKKAVFGHVPK